MFHRCDKDVVRGFLQFRSRIFCYTIPIISSAVKYRKKRNWINSSSVGCCTEMKEALPWATVDRNGNLCASFYSRKLFQGNNWLKEIKWAEPCSTISLPWIFPIYSSFAPERDHSTFRKANRNMKGAFRREKVSVDKSNDLTLTIYCYSDFSLSDMYLSFFPHSLSLLQRNRRVTNTVIVLR